jgi:hypothetical protein
MKSINYIIVNNDIQGFLRPLLVGSPWFLKIDN